MNNINSITWTSENAFTTEFADLLSVEEVKRFIEQIYSITVIKIERVQTPKSNAVEFSVMGMYLHAGFTNIRFEAVFYAYDFLYIFRTIVERFKFTNIEAWQDLMKKKFGEKYAS